MPARSTEAEVEPAILAWARASAGMSIEEAAQSLQTKPERVVEWEEGERHPSMAQLRKMAAAYKRLLSDFFLPEPPKEDPIPHDFRRLPGEVAFRYSRALRYQLRLARQRRELALDLTTELDEEVPTIPIRIELTADPERAGADLRQFLRVSLEAQRSWRGPRASYNAWRAAAERAGILVFQVTGVPPAEMLGFSLSERPLPVIGVNRKLHLNRRTFTLLHECVHVLLESSGICDIEESVLRPPAAAAERGPHYASVLCRAPGCLGPPLRHPGLGARPRRRLQAQHATGGHQRPRAAVHASGRRKLP